MFNNPAKDEIKTILEKTKTIAVVGLSPKPKRPSYIVASKMQGYGYRIIPVRPAVEEVLGEKAYPDLKSIPASLRSQIDMVDIFLAPGNLLPVIDACIELNVPVIWIQEGIINEAEALRAQQAGITVVMDRCIYKDYVQFF